MFRFDYSQPFLKWYGFLVSDEYLDSWEIPKRAVGLERPCFSFQ
jgi:hypothetical protein